MALKETFEQQARHAEETRRLQALYAAEERHMIAEIPEQSRMIAEQTRMLDGILVEVEQVEQSQRGATRRPRAGRQRPRLVHGGKRPAPGGAG